MLRSDGGIITVDLHGLTVRQARARLLFELKRATDADYSLRVLHGYHGGTAIKEMVLSEFAAHPKVRRVERGVNPGETVLVLRPLY